MAIRLRVVDSAHAALQKIERRLYDAVISDVRMPGMDGPGFYEALRERRPEQIEGLGFITGDTLSGRCARIPRQRGPALSGKTGRPEGPPAAFSPNLPGVRSEGEALRPR